MASLTPGTLSNLLQNLNHPTTTTAVPGHRHRSALLQVLAILPKHDVFDFDSHAKTNGFYVRVSDSLHSAYVSVPESDVELILSDKIQLGQFVHVTRFESGSPVPILRGLKPVPKRRPCVGDPKDLISSDCLVKMKKSKERDVRRFSSVNGKIEGEFEARRLSLDCSSRKAWDQSPTPAGKSRGSGSKTKGPSSLSCSTPVLSGRKSSSEKDLVLKPPNSNVAPLKNKNVIVSEKLISKPVQKDLKSSFDSSAKPSHLNKVPVSVKTWSDSKVSWDSVSPTIRVLGKEVICRRNVAFSSAICALEETWATESVLQCMSLFAEICELAETSSHPLVEQFLNLYHKIQTSACVINTLTGPTKSTDERVNNSALWVQAALQTNLSNFSLFTKQDAKTAEKTHYLILENTLEKLPAENKRSLKTRVETAPNSMTKKSPVSSRNVTKKANPERVEWSKGNGLDDAVKLSEKLLLVSRKWFLKYLEDSLNNGFGLRKGEEDSAVAIGLLGQLKRVNQWLNDSGRDGMIVDQTVENLRKKLYGFLLDHVQKAGS